MVRRRNGAPAPDSTEAEGFEPGPNQFYEIVEVWPNAASSYDIGSLPPNIGSAYNEAELSYVAGHFSAAAVMYRKAIERTVKAVHPEGKGMLNQRIRTLEREQRLPPAMIDLMDMVKIIGNDGAHEDEDPMREDVEMGRDFTRLFLTYIWALPAQIVAAKAAREDRD